MILSTFSILTFAPSNLPIVHAAAPTPNVALSVSTANVLDSTGSRVYVTAIGSGFGPSKNVSLTFGLATGTLSAYNTFTGAAAKGESIKGGTLPAVATTDGLGWFKTQFAVPSVVGGFYNATFTDNSTSPLTATAQLTVAPSLVCLTAIPNGVSHATVGSSVSCALTGAPTGLQATLALNVTKQGGASQTLGNQWTSTWTEVGSSSGNYTVTVTMPETFGGLQTLQAVSGTTIEATTTFTVDTSVVYSASTNFVPTTPSVQPSLGSKIAATFHGLPTGTTSVSGLKLNQAGGAGSGTLAVSGTTTVVFGKTGTVTGQITAYPSLSYVGLSDLVYTTNLGSATFSNAIIVSDPTSSKDGLMILQYAGGATSLNSTTLSVIGGKFNVYISGMTPSQASELILDNRSAPTAPNVWSNTTLTVDANGANVTHFTVPNPVTASPCGGHATGICGQRGTYYFTGWDSKAGEVSQVGTTLNLFINPAITYGWAAGYAVGGTATGQIDAGNGFGASETVNIYFGGTFLCKASSDTSGVLTHAITACNGKAIPKTAGPTANILYTNVTLGGSATTSTGIFGNWTIGTVTGPVGTSVAFTGEGFPAGTYDILWGAADQVPVSTVTTATAASSGTTAGEVKGTFSVPNGLGGVHITDLAPISNPTISALYGATSNGLGTGTTSMYDTSIPSISQFTVTPTMTVSPYSVGKVGDLITVTYTGLSLGSDHYLWLNSTAPADVYTGQNVTGFSDLSGSATFTFAIPDIRVLSLTGLDTVTIADSSDSASFSPTAIHVLPFTLFSSMSLSPTVGLPGTVVKAYAHGLSAAGPYLIVWYAGPAVGAGNTFVGRSASQLLPTSTADLTGQITFTFPVPNVPNGQYTVDLVQGATFVASTSLAILYFAGGGAPTFTVGAPLSGVGLAINQVFTSSATLGFEETTNIADNSGAGYMIAHRAGPKVVFTHSDATRVVQSGSNAGQLTFSDYANAVVVGGHAANPTTGFYENASLAHLTAVVNANGTISIMHTPDGVRALNVPLSSITSSNDYFVLQSFQDGGHTVVVLWGIEQYGTLASGVYFDMQYSNLNNLTQGSYVIHWTDSNSNGIPDSGDTFTMAYYGT